MERLSGRSEGGEGGRVRRGWGGAGGRRETTEREGEADLAQVPRGESGAERGRKKAPELVT